MDTVPGFVIKEVDRAHRQALVRVLVRAFRNYPLFPPLFEGQGVRLLTGLESVITFWVSIYFTGPYTVLGRFEPDGLTAAALVTPPGVVVDATMLERFVDHLISEIGDVAVERIAELEVALQATLPVDTHHYLGILAVDPLAQRRGLGRKLLTEVVLKARRSTNSEGVCLTTEAPENVAYYQSHGFRVISKVNVLGITSWGMSLDL